MLRSRTALADKSVVRLIVFLLLSSLSALPQTPKQDPFQLQRDSAARILPSLALQEQSVQRQLASIARSPHGETTPLPAALPLPQSPVDRPGCERLTPEKLSPLIEKSAIEYSLSPRILRAVAQQESSFYPCAVSPAGAMGVMQLMPATARMLDVRDPFDPEQNIRGGTRFLRMLLDRFEGDLSLALGAYNAGPGRVESSGGVPDIPESRAYVTGILRKLRLSPTSAGTPELP